MSFGEFLESTLSQSREPQNAAAKRSDRDIIAELMPLVELDKKRGG